ncbi:MAG: hypothetical protein RIB67_07785 [Miltoncostaeaceae bacterium]
MTTGVDGRQAIRLPVPVEEMFTALAPRTVGPLTVPPLVRNTGPAGVYTGLADAMERGARLTEVDAAGAVAGVVVQNPLPVAVLLVDGEEIAGAKQDRIINLSVLVPAGARLPVPVSCVESGRWGGAGSFSAAPRTASPRLRRGKAEALCGGPREPGRAQGRVWDEVRSMSRSAGSRSATQAYAGVVEARSERVAATIAAFPVVPGQCGAVVALGGRPVCVDVLSRADVFADLWPRLLAGYAADAADAPAPARAPLRRRDLVRLLKAVSVVPLDAAPSAGAGVDVRGASGPLEVTGLLDPLGELVQLSAYVR